jgi:hypothetical protein
MLPPSHLQKLAFGEISLSAQRNIKMLYTPLLQPLKTTYSMNPNIQAKTKKHIQRLELESSFRNMFELSSIEINQVQAQGSFN